MWNIDIKFGAPYSPFSNGLNERNHYSCDQIVEKLMMDNKKMSLQEACDISSWTHNTNISKKRFSPLQLLMGKGAMFPRVNRVEDEENENFKTMADESVRARMKILLSAGEEFRQLEFQNTLRKAEELKVNKFNEEVYCEGDAVLYQMKDKKEWHGPGRVKTSNKIEVEVETENGVMRIHPCRVARYFPDDHEEEGSNDDKTDEEFMKNKEEDVPK